MRFATDIRSWLAGLCAVWLLALPCGGQDGQIVWSKDLNEALMRGASESRPVMIYATTPKCAASKVMEDEALSHPAILELLSQFALLEIDTALDADVAARFQVTQTPTLVLLAPGGKELRRIEGGASAESVASELQAALAGRAAGASAEQAEMREVDALLSAPPVPAGKWPLILSALGRQSARQALVQRILRLQPPPRLELVAELASPRLDVRLGALEVLEQMAGDDFGLDPWLGPADAEEASLVRWKAWAADTKATNIVFSTLTASRMKDLLQDLATGSREAVDRAARSLRPGGREVAEQAALYLQAHTNLPAGAVARIRAVRYAAMLPARPGLDTQGLANRLVFGTLDQQMQGLRALKACGPSAVTVIEDFLSHPNGLVRETAVEMLMVVAGRDALPRLQELAKSERDREVIIGMARSLGKLRSKAGAELLGTLLASEDEDVKIAALAALAKVGSKSQAEAITTCLGDERWRVRVAALLAVKELRLKTAVAAVEKCIGDPDTFVRYSAILTLPVVGEGGKVSKLLTAAFTNSNELKPAVVAALAAQGGTLPASFTADLKKQPAEVILSVLDALGESSSAGLPMAAEFVEHSNPDVSCAALRILADSSGMRVAKYRQLVVAKLQEGSREQVRSILEALPERENELFYESRIQGDDDIEDTLMSLEAGPSGPVGALVMLFDAFSKAAVKKPVSPPPPPVTVDQLFDAFGATGPAPAMVSASATLRSGGADRAALDAALAERMEKDADPEIRRMAALRLAGAGHAKALEKLAKDVEALSTSEKAILAVCCAAQPSHAESLATIRRLLGDPSVQVRDAAVMALSQRLELQAWCDTLMGELLREGTALKPSAVCNYSFWSAGQRNARANLRRWLPRLMTNSAPAGIQVLGIITAEITWSPDDAAALEPLAKSESPVIRRAALHALCAKDKKTPTAWFKVAVADSSPEIRVIVPEVLNRHSREWADDFGEGPGQSQRYDFSSMTMRPTLSAPEREVLAALASDPVASVRASALLALLSAGEPVNAAMLMSAIEASGDAERLASRAADVIERVYTRLNASYAPLLPIVESASMSEDTRERILARIGGAKSPQDAAVATALRTEGATTAAAAPTGMVAQATGRSIDVVFFHEAGCEDCERTAANLQVLRDAFPELKVQSHDMRLTASREMNKAYCEQFGAPDARRGRVPAIFTGAGALFAEEITLERLSDLITRAVDTPLKPPKTATP